MERLVIDIRDKKSILIKQMLRSFGVIIQQDIKDHVSDYKQKLTKVSTWTEDDLKAFERT